MGSMNNVDIRILIAEKGLKHKDIAKEMGISPEWLSRLLRYDLDECSRERIIKAMDNMESNMSVNYENLSYSEKVELFKKLTNDGIAVSDKTCKRDLVNSLWHELSGHGCPAEIARKITDMADFITANYEAVGHTTKKIKAIPKDKEILYKEVVKKLCDTLHPYEESTKEMWKKIKEKELSERKAFDEKMSELRERQRIVKNIGTCRSCKSYRDGRCGNANSNFSGTKVNSEGFCMKWNEGNMNE